MTKVRIYNVANMSSFSAIRENKIIAKISEFTGHIPNIIYRLTISKENVKLSSGRRFGATFMWKCY